MTTTRMRRRFFFVLSVLCIILGLQSSLLLVDGFPSLLVETESGCMTLLSTEEVIMNNPVVAYKDSSHPHVRLLAQEANKEDEWKPGPKISINASELPVSFQIRLDVNELQDVQFAVETSQGGFFPSGGGCEGKRRAAVQAKNNVELVIQSLPIQVLAGWATGHEAVQLTEPIEFVALGEKTDDKSSKTPPLDKEAAEVPKADQEKQNETLTEGESNVTTTDKAKNNNGTIRNDVKEAAKVEKKKEEDQHHFELPDDRDMIKEIKNEQVVKKRPREIKKEEDHVPPPRQHVPKKVYQQEKVVTKRKKKKETKLHVLHGYHLEDYTPSFEMIQYAYGGIFFVGAVLVLLLVLESLGGKKHKGRRDL